MKSNIFRFIFPLGILAVIFFVGIFLRFYQLGQNPPGLTWDEASLGYNAYSILQTGKDEYGNFLPVDFRSFDDHKPPLYVYLTVPSVAFFGLTEFAVRFPSAVLGSLTVLVTYFFVKEILLVIGVVKKEERHGFALLLDKKNTEIIALFSAFFFAISPWSLQFSRAAFEGNIGLFFLILASFFFLKGTTNGKFFLFSALFFVCSFYSYHSFRLVGPIFIILAATLFAKELLLQKKYVLFSLLLAGVLSVPIALTFLGTSGSGARLSMVGIFSSTEILPTHIAREERDKLSGDNLGAIFHNRRIVYGLSIAKGYLDHWNPDFLFFHGDGGRQHHAVEMGMIYFWEFPFILLGVASLLFVFNKRIAFLFLLFAVSPIASSLTTGTPHPVRAIAMIPALHIFTAVGAYCTFLFLVRQKTRVIGYVGIMGFFILLLGNVLYYFHQYYVHTPIEYGDFWQYGYKELFVTVKPYEKDYDKIIVTYRYDQPYIYYLFYNKIDPAWYQGHWDSSKTGNVERMQRVVGKYEFKNIDWERDSKSPRTLIVGAPWEVPSSSASLKDIRFLDGAVAFRIISI